MDSTRSARGGVHRLDDGREPQHEGHRDRQRDQQPGAASPATSAAPARRRSRSPGSATPWARARPASRRACRAIASSRAPRTATSWRRSGTCRSSAFRRRAAWPIPTSSRRRSTGSIRALWIIATNPIVSFPNLGALQQALEGLEFLVVQDGYPPDADLRVRAPGAAGRDVGREGRDLHQLRAARQQGESRRRRRPARRGPTSTSFSALADALGVRDELFPGWTTPARRLRGMEARLGRPALRLLGHDLRGHRAARRHPVAVSGRRDRPGDDAAALHRRRLPDRRRPGAADSGDVGAVSRAAERRVSRSCSTPAAPSSTGTRAPRPGRCRSSSGCRRTPGSR